MTKRFKVTMTRTYETELHYRANNERHAEDLCRNDEYRFSAEQEQCNVISEEYKSEYSPEKSSIDGSIDGIVVIINDVEFQQISNDCFVIYGDEDKFPFLNSNNSGQCCRVYKSIVINDKYYAPKI